MVERKTRGERRMVERKTRGERRNGDPVNLLLLSLQIRTYVYTVEGTLTQDTSGPIQC